MIMTATNKKLAALVTLLALLAGPAAGLLSSRPGCFVGWLPIVGYLVCPRTSLPNPLLQPPSSPAPEPTGAGLSVGHYYKSSSYCPNAEELVRVAVESATNRTRGIGAGLIRLFFHDAFVRGCDASVLLNTTASGNSDTEREGPPNQNSLRGFEVIDAAKAAVEDACPGVVSCADILAFAARDASSILSGGAISFDVPAGRYDGRQSFAGETDQLPGPDSTVQQLNASFVAQGLNLADMVTLSGAHSIGRARCLFFTSRLSAMDPGYAQQLDTACNGTGSPNTRVNQDPVTPVQLDNQYYKNIDKFVLFASDAALSSPDTASQVNDSASIPGKWETDFAAAMVKMGKIGVKTDPGFDAEIRKVCWKVNDRPGY